MPDNPLDGGFPDEYPLGELLADIDSPAESPPAERPPAERPPGESPPDDDRPRPGLEPKGPAPHQGMTDDKRAEILVDHYKDTYQVLLGYSKERDRFFLYILLLIAIIAVDCLSSGTLSRLINGYISKQLTASPWESVEFTGIIHLMVSFLFFYFVSRYYRRCMLLDRAYRYLSACEGPINRWMGGDYVTRESRAYRSRRGVPTNGEGRERSPFFLCCIEFQFYVVFPLAVVFLVGYLTYQSVDALQAVDLRDFSTTFRQMLGELSATDVCILICHLAIIGYSLLYLLWVAFGRRKAVGRDEAE